MKQSSVIVKKTRTGYITSIVFLSIVVLSTISLHFYNNNSLLKIENIKKDISSREANIKVISKEPNLQIYSLLELNKWVIESYSLMNKITSYITHMGKIEERHNLQFSGFNLNNWKITTNVKIISDNNWIAFQKTRDFINNYRMDTKSLFDLDFINGVEGMDEIKFPVNFKIK
jgi:hypothetical protein